MAGALLIGGLATDATSAGTGSYAVVNDLLGALSVVALWWRRRWPVSVAAVTFVAAAAAPMAGGAAIAGVYTVIAYYRGRWTSLGVGALCVLYLVSGTVTLVVFPDEDLGVVGGALAAAVLTAAACGWGLTVRSRRELLAALAERAERAEADQHARMAEARRAERTRIAVEMHDVLAHRLTLLGLHAGAMELHPGAAPDELAAAARVVRSNAHQALDDLRAVIGVLRDGDIGLAPQPTIGDLDSLLAECRVAGMDLDVIDTLPPARSLPTEVGRHAYQIVREALTNARKHAPGHPVRLILTASPADGVQIEVVNSVAMSDGPADAAPGAGVGLVGMRERVELAGGTLEHGLDTAQHRLCAWLPWPA